MFPTNGLENTVLTIESGYLKVGLRNDQIVFKKRVRVTAGVKSLTTNKLILIPSQGVFQTNHSFILKDSQQELVGDYLKIGLYLDHIFVIRNKREKASKVSQKKFYEYFNIVKAKILV